MDAWGQIIPTVPITQEQVDSKLQCTVCCEDFQVREPVSLLECAHVFHPSCILPWLQLNTTCPVCRHDLQASENLQVSGEEDEPDVEMSSLDSSSDDGLFTVSSQDMMMFTIPSQDMMFTISLQGSAALEDSEMTEEILSATLNVRDTDSDWSLSMISCFSSSSDDASDND
uniref:RING-type domain-containing protein n=1 Tax=Cuerna arida TaxID=1464854 RepID=A0A1B6ELA8_9HEMI